MQIIPLFYHLPKDCLWQCKLMLVHTLNHLWQQSLSTSPSPDLLYANEIFPHTPWTFYGNEIFPHLRIPPPPPHTHSPDLLWFFHTPLHIITTVSYNGPPDCFWTPSHIIIAVSYKRVKYPRILYPPLVYFNPPGILCYSS